MWFDVDYSPKFIRAESEVSLFQLTSFNVGPFLLFSKQTLGHTPNLLLLPGDI